VAADIIAAAPKTPGSHSKAKHGDCSSSEMSTKCELHGRRLLIIAIGVVRQCASRRAPHVGNFS
jgi:hypothetical protein